MNAQEALEIIKNELPFTSGVIEEALDLVEICVSKQIPKIPVVSSDDRTNYYRYKCAVCGNDVVVGGMICDFCPRCGQKLWAKE